MNRVAATIRRIGTILTASALLTVVGCSQGPDQSEEGSTATVENALSTSAAAAFGFESLTSWTISSGTRTLGAPRTQGQRALQLAGPVNYTTITSAPTALTAADIAPLTQPGAFVAVDIALPTQQPNPSWFGATQMFVSCQARGVYNEYLGQIELTGRRLGNFQTYRFAVPAFLRQQLAGRDCSNFSVTLVINVPSAGTGTYRVDNIRFKSASDPSSTGNGSSVDLVALRGPYPSDSTPGTATFPESRIQVPGSFHVATGNAGTGSLTLLLAASPTDRTTCTYTGADQGTSYRFASCSRGELAGDLVIASSATLTIVSSAGPAKVKAQLAINPTGDELVSGLTPIPTFWGDTAAEVGAISGAYFQAVAQQPQGGAHVTATSPALGKRATVDPVRIRNLLDPNEPPLSPNDPPFNQYGDVGGNDLANAYWKLEGFLDGLQNTDGSFTTKVDAAASVHGVLLGFDQDVLRGHIVYTGNSGVIGPTGRTGASATGTARVFLFDGLVKEVSLDQLSGEETLFSTTEGFDLPVISFGIFSVNVGLSATVDVKLAASAQVDGLAFTLTPGASVSASISGNVNILVASGGITATVSLIDLDLPITASAFWNISTAPAVCKAVLAFNLNSSAVVSTGAGSIDAHVTFGNCDFFGLCHTEDWNITRWGPLASATVQFLTIDEPAVASVDFPRSFCDLPPTDVSIDCVADGDTLIVGLPVTFQSTALAADRQDTCTTPPCLDIDFTIPCSGRSWDTGIASDQIALLRDDSADFPTMCPTSITFMTPGSRTVTMTANENNAPVMVTKTINVVPATGPGPFVRMLLPAQGCAASETGDNPMQLLAASLSPSGSPVTFEWDFGAAAPFTAIGSGSSVTWNLPNADLMTNVRVTGTSADGSVTVSTPLNITRQPL
jgi:hypothetical protein